MSFENIPRELRLYNNWCLWRYEAKDNGEQTKIPYQLNGEKASPLNPKTWTSFDAVVDYKTKLNGHSGFDGIGFFFSEFDPFCGIDLDYTDNQEWFARQLKVYNNFNSYSEWSPSGKGLHIICYGKVPQGRRRDKIEIYSSGRYFTFTGSVYNPAPIAHRQELLDILWAEMGPETPVYHLNANDKPELFTDEEILENATNASNGDKFFTLFQGDWKSLYPSQSEADFALIDILAFYTQNIEQIKRLFWRSQLGKRDKAKRFDYLNYMIQKSFDRQLPFVDLSAITINGAKFGEAAIEGTGAGKTPIPSTSEPASNAQAQPGIGAKDGEANNQSSAAAAKLIGEALAVKLGPPEPIWPPGLLGEIAAYIYSQAARPVFEIALAGAIALMAGICGRAFNVSDTGLNQYILVLAMTGANKEAAAAGISKIMAKVRQNVPNAMEFMGPSDVKSDAGLIKWIDKKPCFLSIVGEFGIRFEQMTGARKDKNEIGIKKALLDLYAKSGKGAILNPLAYSDKDKNTGYIKSPSFTLFGEGVPESFYPHVTEEVIADGLLPRFLVIEYKGKSQPLSKTFKDAEPPKSVIDKLSTLVSHCLASMQNDNVIDVKMTSEAEKIFDQLEETCRERINNTTEVSRQLLNRVHMKSMKLAAILAVGICWWQPVITKDDALWAIEIVNRGLEEFTTKITLGEIGEESKPTFASDDNQLSEMVRVIGRWARKEEMPKYGLTDQMIAKGVYTFSCLQMRLNKVACFRKDKMGSTYAFKRAIQVLIDSGDIQELNPNQTEQQFGKRAKCFIIKDYQRFVNAR